MNNESSGHPTDLLLQYIDARLPAEDMNKIKEHVARCAECLKELQGLLRVTGALKENNDTMCPEPWELCIFAQSGQDPSGRLARHLAECPLCREETERCKVLPDMYTLPQEVWERGKDLLPGTERDRGRATRTRSWTSGLANWLFSLLRVPYVAVAVAAAVLVLVIMNPRESPLPVLGLSPVTWGQPTASLRLMAPEPQERKPSEYGEPGKRVIAALIFLKQFEKPVAQSRIDEFYETVRPRTDFTAHAIFLPPSVIKQAVAKGTVKSASRKELLGTLYHNLHVSEVLLVTIASRRESFDVDIEAIDTATGRILKKKADSGMSESEIPLKLQQAWAILR